MIYVDRIYGQYNHSQYRIDTIPHVRLSYNQQQNVISMFLE